MQVKQCRLEITYVICQVIVQDHALLLSKTLINLIYSKTGNGLNRHHPPQGWIPQHNAVNNLKVPFFSPEEKSQQSKPPSEEFGTQVTHWELTLKLIVGSF